MPCGRFGANAAWLRLAVLTHNVLTALKRLVLPPELLKARPKRLRFLIFNTPGKLVHHARRTLLRLGRSWQRFPTGTVHFACCLCRLANPRPEIKLSNRALIVWEPQFFFHPAVARWPHSPLPFT
jgi:hypothetical protein